MYRYTNQIPYETKFEVLERDNRAIVIEYESGNWEACHKTIVPKIKNRLRQQCYKAMPTGISNNMHKQSLECTLYLSNKCNLGCKYCYSTYLRTAEGYRELMSLDMLEKIIPAVLAMNWESVNFFLYGGEPLLDLGLIRNVVRLVHYANNQYGKRVTFYIQTNGTLFNSESIEFIIAAGIDVGVSMDGPPDIQNQNRPTKEGVSSYELVANGLNMLCQNGIPFTITSTITQPSDLERVFDYLLRSHWTSSIRLSPMLPEGRAYQCENNSHDSKFQEALADAHLRVVDRILANNRKSYFKIRCGNIVSMVNNLIVDNRSDLCLRSPCGAGYGMIEFHPNGDIVTCDKTYYKPELGKVGNIADLDHPEDLQMLYDSSPLRRKIASRTVDNIPACKDCAFKRFCGGGCCLGTYLRVGSLVREDVLCEYRKRMFEGLLWRLVNNPYNVLLLTKPQLLQG